MEGAGVQGKRLFSERERLAILSLWAIPGIGPKALAAIGCLFRGDLTAILSLAPKEWMSELKLTVPVRGMLARVTKMENLGNCLMDRAKKARMGVAFPGDDAFPSKLSEIADAPPVLFHRGFPSAPRRRLAMVGSRHPDQGFLKKARQFANAVAQGGVGIISGAAIGVDSECHLGALEARAETWAFVGSGLDELDPAQAELQPKVLKGGGVFYSELPPGVRASTTTFPRRNRLISGSADAVLILRASRKSGALHTAKAALDQGRPLLALPGEPSNESAFGCNALIRVRKAKLCMTPEDAWAALRVSAHRAAAPADAGVRFDPEALSTNARAVYAKLRSVPQSFDEVLGACQLPSAPLISALCELELMGLVVQHPGRHYEKV
jgi:DNA protecting protein DprA